MKLNIPKKTTVLYIILTLVIYYSLFPSLLGEETADQYSTNGIKYIYIEKGDGSEVFLGNKIRISILKTDKSGEPLNNEQPDKIELMIGLEEDYEIWTKLLLHLRVGDKVLAYEKDNADQHKIDYYVIKLHDLLTDRELKAYDIPGKTRIVTESGLEYIIIHEGSGLKAAPGYTVTFHFTGYLEDMTMFASSYAQDEAETITLGIDHTMPGWFEGLCLMRQGDVMRLILPPELAFGEEGSQGIVPPNATVVFDIDLLKVE